ncbi:hypothetical protein ACFP63_15015 [Oerskovia jenensis]|uniref:CopC domain-containing protein n=1 Tax=Oerskovia jenensis TaxID=162169 RepID=A0ABS2LDD9_9CELL|nr:hypothetical protein [Oerskovia jenensis]MBM7478431.1 hypothetical protein [Oerskovia jenensis]
MRFVDPRAAARPLVGTAGVSLLVVALLVGAAPATANPADPSGGDPQGIGLQVDVSGVTSQSQVDVDAGNAVPGGALGVRGSGLVPLTPYDVHLHSAYAPPVRLATAISLADGTFGLSTLMPDTVQPGTHVVRVTDPVTGVYLDTAAFEVRAAPEPGGGPGGTDPTPGVIPGTGAGSGSGERDLAATGPLPQRPATGAGVEAEGGLAFTGATLVGTVAAAGALVVTGAVVATGAARRRRRARTT